MQAILTVGVSASGKSTWAEQFIAEQVNPEQWHNSNRDEIRWSLLGGEDWSKWNWKREKEVTQIQRNALAQAAFDGKNIIVSDTNLNPKFRNDLCGYLQSLGYGSVEEKVFPISFEEACKRDTARPNGVGYSVIAKQMEQMNEYMKTFNPQEYPERWNKSRVWQAISKCIIVDIDGTLAHMTGRSPYDFDRVNEDAVDIAVANICQFYYDDGYSVILLSGRDEACRTVTVDWLHTNCIAYSRLFMRSEMDRRQDTVVKKELFDAHIRDLYDVEFVIDDRPCVCRQWLDMGLKVLQVGNPYIEF